MRVIGLSSRVSNEQFQDIVALWDQFYSKDIKNMINDRVSDDVIAVYTDYEGDYKAPYKLLIGYEVSNECSCPQGLDETQFDNGHTVYTVKGPLPDVVIEQWKAVWNDTSQKRAYVADYDRYKTDGSVDIHVQYLP